MYHLTFGTRSASAEFEFFFYFRSTSTDIQPVAAVQPVSAPCRSLSNCWIILSALSLTPRTLRSAYLAQNSAETEAVEVITDLLRVLDSGDLAY